MHAQLTKELQEYTSRTPGNKSSNKAKASTSKSALGEIQIKRQRFEFCTPQEADFSWLWADNGHTARRKRNQLAVQTLEAVQNSQYFHDGKQIKLRYAKAMAHGTGPIVCFKAPLRKPPKGKNTRFRISKIWSLDELDAIHAEKGNDARIGIINGASAYHAGGGFLSGGRHAMEESLCSMSSFFMSLQRATHAAQQGTLIPPTGCLASPYVEVFRHGAHKGYKIRKDVILIDVVSVAMFNNNPNVADAPRDMPDDATVYLQGIQRKFLSAMHAFVSLGTKTIIVPAVGCGVYRNSPHAMGCVVGQAFNIFNGLFDEVVFCGTSEFTNPAFSSAIKSQVAAAAKNGQPCPYNTRSSSSSQLARTKSSSSSQPSSTRVENITEIRCRQKVQKSPSMASHSSHDTSHSHSRDRPAPVIQEITDETGTNALPIVYPIGANGQLNHPGSPVLNRQRCHDNVTHRNWNSSHHTRGMFPRSNTDGSMAYQTYGSQHLLDGGKQQQNNASQQSLGSQQSRKNRSGQLSRHMSMSTDSVVSHGPLNLAGLRDDSPSPAVGFRPRSNPKFGGSNSQSFESAAKVPPGLPRGASHHSREGSRRGSPSHSFSRSRSKGENLLTAKDYGSPRGSPARMQSSGDLRSLPGGSPPSSPTRSPVPNGSAIDNFRLTIESVSPQQANPFNKRIRGMKKDGATSDTERQPLLNQRVHNDRLKAQAGDDDDIYCVSSSYSGSGKQIS